MDTEYRESANAGARTWFDWLLEAIALASLAAMFVVLTPNWNVKKNLWLLPALGTLHYALMTVLGVLRLSPQHETPRVRGVRIRIVTWIKASMLAGLAYITWITVETAQGRANGLDSGFLPAMALMIVLPPLLTWRRMRNSGAD